jgi:hypothetical protein
MVHVQPTKAKRSVLRAKRAGGLNEIAVENRSKTDLGRRSSGALRAQNQSGSLFCRLDMNHPPTAVGGISTFCAKHEAGAFRTFKTKLKELWSFVLRPGCLCG